MQFLRSVRVATVILSGTSATTYCTHEQVEGRQQQWQVVISAAHRRAWVQDGVVVIDGVMPPKVVDAARRELFALHDSGRLTCTVQGADIRRDNISWLGKSSAPPDLKTLGEGASFLLEELPHLVRELIPDRQVVAPQRVMCAVYDGNGAFYAPHRDNRPRAAPATIGDDDDFAWLSDSEQCDREITGILYLNEHDWDPERDGGILRCFVGANADDTTGSTASRVLDIVPAGGRLVLFDSRALLHEVRPSYRRRAALSVWLLDSKAKACN